MPGYKSLNGKNKRDTVSKTIILIFTVLLGAAIITNVILALLSLDESNMRIYQKGVNESITLPLLVMGAFVIQGLILAFATATHNSSIEALFPAAVYTATVLSILAAIGALVGIYSCAEYVVCTNLETGEDNPKFDVAVVLAIVVACMNIVASLYVSSKSSMWDTYRP